MQCIIVLTLYLQMLDPCKSPASSETEDGKRDTRHAPDLLEGPDIDEEGMNTQSV